ncbi:FKBP-type peptidyl-prolyl cis-trans isomerase [Saccharophagus degradans]|uniref:Peptidyl-prolyl cis-trans isomerase n=1 Tax=Saccharophagus degradans (strain 2-40 / ATCC 43961 / DSM 17024) TaxID=203122 RepID=Q21JP1_SACD2|nr:FKBP-type peptidyl-prolyl cis-trans isomerase [Saccharophagus degradans]ABD81083.1 peptidylprolyl isomerase, FKBP-type [Saccharophagus degradans 2-40]ABD81088.1 peptidylprolyl isomerase, FKBP-type [Saccharophagus degradans 2-40]
MKSGIKLISEEEGFGEEVERQITYLMKLRFWLNKGDPIKWNAPWGLIDRASLSDDGETLTTDLRVDRESMFNGLFYGVEGMRIGGVRKLIISPHLAYGEAGIETIIPPNALIIVEVSVLEKRIFA